MHKQVVNKQNVKAVILAGGCDFGRCPLASRLPTALWPLAGKPAIEHLLVHLVKQGIDRAVICSNGDGSLLAESIYANNRLELKFLDELKKKRKVALRLGILEDRKRWIIKPSKTKELLTKKLSIDDLTEDDVQFDFSQKRVDIKIGLDIASMTLKNQVEQIILISGDSDFVPAAKLARREGIDFLLDPMWNPIKPHLFEHIDGLVSKIKRPK